MGISEFNSKGKLSDGLASHLGKEEILLVTS